MINKKLETSTMFFYKVCKVHLDEFERTKKELAKFKSLKPKAPIERIKTLKSKQQECAVIVIVFAAMYLEAYICHFGRKYTTKSFYKNHLDRLGFVQKWAIIPKLVTGKDFPINSEAFRKLKKLNKDRNTLIHFKPYILPEEPENAESFAEEKHEELFQSMYDALETIKQVETEFVKMVGYVDFLGFIVPITVRDEDEHEN